MKSYTSTSSVLLGSVVKAFKFSHIYPILKFLHQLNTDEDMLYDVSLVLTL